MKHYLFFIGTLLMLFVLFSCQNPFAPAIYDYQDSTSILGDQTTVEGIFTNWRYSYLFKDTTVYGNLLADDFKFYYKNYDEGVDRFWSRNDDMITTSRLFSASQNIDLIWNQSVSAFGDSLYQDISRGFSLQIQFAANDIIRVQGRANIILQRANSQNNWKITSWRDESNY